MSAPSWGLPAARCLLAATGLIYLYLGAVFVLWPVGWAQKIGFTLDADGVVEIRAVYGGLELGLGVFFLVAALRREWVGVGLWALCLTFAGLAVCRALGLALAEGPGPMPWKLFAVEASETVLSAAALWITRGAEAA
ncbi:MAG: DUF4345 family protein [Planctomycetota bacterium]